MKAKEACAVILAIGASVWSPLGVCDRLMAVPLEAIVASSEIIADVEIVQGRRDDPVDGKGRDGCGYLYEAMPKQNFKGTAARALRFYSRDQLVLGGRYLIFLPLKKEGPIQNLDLSEADKSLIERFATLNEERTICAGMPVLEESLPPRAMLIDVHADIALGAPHVRLVLPSALGVPKSIDRVQVTLEFEQIGKGNRPEGIAVYEWLPYHALVQAIRSWVENSHELL
ncbi:MAG: hypothetical protein KIT37_07420 [Steroidobacteraceae bacterium]|nr:hypothetical protein [Steroidobacteraceae bacterium]